MFHLPHWYSSLQQIWLRVKTKLVNSNIHELRMEKVTAVPEKQKYQTVAKLLEPALPLFR